MLRQSIYFFLLLNIASTAMAEPKWQREIEWVRAAYGIDVKFDKPEFPMEWKDRSPHAELVPEEKRLLAIRKLRIALVCYNPAFIRQNLSQVILLNQLILNETDYGGTVDQGRGWLYITEDCLNMKRTNQMAMGFHHEFAHLLYHRYKDKIATDTWQRKFDEEGWRNINAIQFRYDYEHSDYKALRTGKTTSLGDDKLYEQGFLCSYGTTAIEEDFATFAECLISDPALILELKRKYPLIRKKIELLEQFLTSIGYKKQGEVSIPAASIGIELAEIQDTETRKAVSEITQKLQHIQRIRYSVNAVTHVKNSSIDESTGTMLFGRPNLFSSTEALTIKSPAHTPVTLKKYEVFDGRLQWRSIGNSICTYADLSKLLLAGERCFPENTAITPFSGCGKDLTIVSQNEFSWIFFSRTDHGEMHLTIDKKTGLLQNFRRQNNENLISTEKRFSKFELNPSLSKGSFQFVPPRGIIPWDSTENWLFY